VKFRLLLYAAAALLLVGFYWFTRFRIEQLAHGRAEGQAMSAEAKLRGGIVGRRVSPRELEKGLSPAQRDFVHAIRKVAPHSRIDSRTTAKITIEDSPAGKIVETAEGPREWRDDYDRFRLVFPDQPDGPYIFHRRQAIGVDILAIKSVDGKTRVAKVEAWEYNPRTGDVIPSTGLAVGAKLDFVEDKPPAPPILHLRGLAAVDHRIAPGAGAEFINFERTKIPFIENLTLSALGYWKTEKTEGRLVGQLGYRIPSSNVTIGGYLGAALPSGSLVGGAGVAFQVTR